MSAGIRIAQDETGKVKDNLSRRRQLPNASLRRKGFPFSLKIYFATEFIAQPLAAKDLVVTDITAV